MNKSNDGSDIYIDQKERVERTIDNEKEKTDVYDSLRAQQSEKGLTPLETKWADNIKNTNSPFQAAGVMVQRTTELFRENTKDTLMEHEASQLSKAVDRQTIPKELGLGEAPKTIEPTDAKTYNQLRATFEGGKDMKDTIDKTLSQVARQTPDSVTRQDARVFVESARGINNGPVVGFVGGNLDPTNRADMAKVFNALDSVKTKHPNMRLAHRDVTPDDSIAKQWAVASKTDQLVPPPSRSHDHKTISYNASKALAHAPLTGVVSFGGSNSLDTKLVKHFESKNIGVADGNALTVKPEKHIALTHTPTKSLDTKGIEL